MRKLRYREIKYLAARYSSGKQRIGVQIQSSDFGGPAVLHQAMQRHCLGHSQCIVDGHGLCNAERRQMLANRLPAWGEPTRPHLPLLDPGLPPSFSTAPQITGREKRALNKFFPASAGQPWGGQGGGFLARTLESFQLFTPPPPGRELKRQTERGEEPCENEASPKH